MKNVNKDLVKLLIFIFLFGFAIISAAYAYLKVNVIQKGNGNINIQTKGVDTFEIIKKSDANLDINFNNFRPVVGHDVSSNAVIDLKLFTTNNSSKACYKINLNLPNEKIFEYSASQPELVISIVKKDGNKETILIDNKDITVQTGIINIADSLNSENYIHTISAGQNESAMQSIVATVTYKWFKDVNQAINNGKKYEASLDIKTVNCDTGKEILAS